MPRIGVPSAGAPVLVTSTLGIELMIREFRLADYNNVVDLWLSVGIAPSIGDDQTGIEQRLQRDTGLFLVAEENGKLIGAVMGTYDGRRGWINHLAVCQQFQSRAIGSALLDALESRLREKGCAKINLLIEMNNQKVQPFYERLGYVRDDLIFMEKWLR